MYNLSIVYKKEVLQITEQEVEVKFRKLLKQDQEIIDSGFNVDELNIKLELRSQENANHSCVLYVFRDNMKDFKFLRFNEDLFQRLLSDITGRKIDVSSGVYNEQYLASKHINDREDGYNLGVAEVDGLWFKFIEKCNEMSYSEYLKTKHWKYFRDNALQY